MRIKGFVWAVVLLSLLFGSCAGNKKITHTQPKAKKSLNKADEQKYYYVFLEANRKKVLGDINGALALYYQCLELHPNSDASMSEIAKINEITQNYDVAIKYAKNAVELNSENKWYQLNLAKLYIITKDYENAIVIYKNLLKKYEDNIEIPYNLAVLYNQMKEYKKAIEFYDYIENKKGVNENLTMAKQQLYLKIGNKTKAYNEINKLIKHYPNDSRYYGILAEMYTNDNLFLKAEENYKKLFELDSTSQLGQFSIIDFYRKKMDYDNAFVTIDKVINNKEIAFEQKVLIFVSLLNNRSEFEIYNLQIEEKLLKLKQLYPNEKDSYTLYADFLIKKNKIKDAQLVIEHIVDNYSGNVVVWEQLLSIYSFENNMDDLYLRSKTAIDSFPEHAMFYLFRGIASNRLDKHEEAISVLKKGLKQTDNNPKLELDFYTNLGDAYNSNGNYKQSDYYFQLVLKQQPNNLYVINNYSYYLSLREEKLEYAESISRKTVEAEPDNNTYLDTYAWILFKLERYQDALYYIKKAIEKGGIDSNVVVEHYGDILFKAGNKEKALEMWKLSKEMGNTSKDLIKKIEIKSLK